MMSTDERIEKLEKIINILLGATRESLVDGFCNRPMEEKQAVFCRNSNLEKYELELNKIDKDLITQSSKVWVTD